MKNMVKIISRIMLVILILQTLYIPNVQATTYFENIISSGDNFVDLGKNSYGGIDKGKVQTAVDFIYNTLFIIGTAVAVIIGVILGIKYMTQSVEEQAKVKETLIIYAVGCIVTFGAFGIWKAVILLLQQM